MNNKPAIRDFSENVPAQQTHSSLVESQRVNKEVEAAVLMAHRFQRNEQDSYNRIVNTCTRPAFAQKAIYSFNRGGTRVEGPSIRLAELVARSWGNMQFGVKELERKDGCSLVESFCWDLETNTRSVKEFTVNHVRDTKQGPKALMSERDIYEMVANQGARRLRNCILSCIPEDVIESAVTQINQTLIQSAQGKAVDMQSKIRSMSEAFLEIGVTREQLEIYLNSKIEGASAKQIVDLGKIYTSIKDGYAEPTDFFKGPSIAPELKKLDDIETDKNKVAKVESLYIQAEEIGIPKAALDSLAVDLENPKSVEQGIDFLEVMISDRMEEIKKDG